MSQTNGRGATLRAKRAAIAVAAAFLPWDHGQAQTTTTQLPTGERVVHGQVNVSRSADGTSMTIDHGTLSGIVNWHSFSIPQAHSVHVNQDPAAALLNRVTSNDPSHIFGSLTGYGKFFLVNNAGVLFGPSASVSTGSLIASTLSITDQDFLAGNYRFFNPGSAGTVINEGSITTGGFTALIGPQVTNDGVIVAHAGTVALTAGNRVSLSVLDDRLISINVDEAAYKASVVNTGQITADGGTVFLKARSMNDLLDTVINTSGVIRARLLVERNGEIVLDGGGANGGIVASGALEAGHIAISGATVQIGGAIIADSASITASGALVSETGSGSIEASRVDVFAQGSVDLNGANRIAGALSGMSMQGDFSLTNTGDLNLSASAFLGDVNVVNAGSLNVANSVSGHNVAITTTGAGSDLNVTGSLSSSASMLVNVDGALIVTAAGVQTPPTPGLPAFPRLATVASFGGQDITARSIQISATDGAQASINNQGAGDQRITALAGGIDIRSANGPVTPAMPSSVAHISNGGTAFPPPGGTPVAGASQTIRVMGGAGVNVEARGGSASISQTGGGLQQLLVTNADQIKVNGVTGSASVSASGAQTLSITGAGGNAIEVGSAGAVGFSQIRAGGTQTITAGTGGESGRITIVGTNAPAALVGISAGSPSTPGDTQKVSASGSISLQGGSATSQIPIGNPPALSSSIAWISHNSSGQQTIDAGALVMHGGAGLNNPALIASNQGGPQQVRSGSIALQGGSSGGNNGAFILSTTGGNQTVIVPGGSISIAGGTGGSGNRAGIVTNANQTIGGDPEVGNHPVIVLSGGGGNGNSAAIQATSTDSSKLQKIRARSIELRGGTATEASASLNAAQQDIATTAGGVLLQAGSGLNAGVRIGGLGGNNPGSTKLTLTVAGDLLMNGGVGDGVSLGSANAAPFTQANNITVSATGDILLTAGPGGGARIGASGQANPTNPGTINVTAGHTLNVGSGTGIRASGPVTAISLAAEKLVNDGAISNGGGTNTGGVTLRANAFDLDGGTIQAGAAVVAVRPLDGAHSFGIQADADTTLSNADLAKISTTNFVVLGSAVGDNFTGDMIIGHKDEAVLAPGKNLAFFRSLSSTGTTTIGTYGVSTDGPAGTGDIIVNAGGGAIVSEGGTLRGDEIALRAAQGVGSAAAPIHTAANALAASNLGSGGVFVREADGLALRALGFTIGGIPSSFSNFSTGKFELSAGGALAVSELVESLGTMDVKAAGGLALATSTGDAGFKSAGGQNIEAQSLSLAAQNGLRASIENSGGEQTIDIVAGGIDLQGAGGAGVAQIINSGGNQTVTATGPLNVLGGALASRNVRNSGIFNNSLGLQKVHAHGITLRGADSGTNAGAVISSPGSQEIDARGGDVDIFGGNGGVTNNAAILAGSTAQQTVRAHHITLENGSGGTDTVAAIQAGHQLIDATGNVTLTSQGALVGGAPGGPGVRIGAPQNTPAGTDLTLLVDGNVTLNGGFAAGNGAALGSSGAITNPPTQAAPNTIRIDAGESVILNAGTRSDTGVRIGYGGNGPAGGDISIKAGGSITLNDGRLDQRNATIRTSDNVSLEAASITESRNGFIVADTLNLNIRGDGALAGPNEVTSLSAPAVFQQPLAAPRAGVGGDLTFNNTKALSVTSAVESGGEMTLTIDGALSVVGAGTQDAILRSTGGQTITATSVNVTAQDGRRAVIENNGAGEQKISTGALSVNGGSALNYANLSGILQNAAAAQTINASSIDVIGTNTGSNNGIFIRAATGAQSLAVTGDINIAAGAGGEAWIQGSPMGTVETQQTISARNITMKNAGADDLTSPAGTNSFAALQAGKQDIQATGDVTLKAGRTAGTQGGVRLGGLRNPVAQTATNLDLRVDGDLVLQGGTGAENGASIGTSGSVALPNRIDISARNVKLNAGTGIGASARIGSGSNALAGGTILIDAEQGIELNGTAESAAIRTLGSVTLDAGFIIERNNGFIRADDLTSITTGSTTLTGRNQINRFYGTSGGALTLVDGGTLEVLGITTTNAPITLTTDTLINRGDISNGGGASAAVVLNADKFNLTGGDVHAGASAVAVRPRTPSNVFLVGSGQASGPNQTSLTNADIAKLHTSNFIIIGSGLGAFSGNMIVGQSERVDSANKNLAFFRTGPGTISIGAQGVTTSGDVIVSSDGGSIASVADGRGITADEVQLRATQGIGQRDARVNTDARALTVGTAGDAFVTEANDLELRTIALDVSGTPNITNTGTQGTLDLIVGGTVDLTGPVSSGGPMNINAGGALNVNNAVLSSNGGQTITAQSLNVLAQNGGLAQILNSGFGVQQITAGTLAVQTVSSGIPAPIPGTAEIRNNSGGAQTIIVTGDHLNVHGEAAGTAAIVGLGNQTIDMTGAPGKRITLGSNDAQGESSIRSGGIQVITGSADIVMTGGSGPVADRSNAMIVAFNPNLDADPSIPSQVINAGTITLANSSNTAANNSVAAILGARQNVNTTGDVTLTANASGGELPGVRIGGLGGGGAPATPTDLRLNVGRDLILTAGTVAKNGVGIGSTASRTAPPLENMIRIQARNVILNSGTEPGTGARIGSPAPDTGFMPGGGDISIVATESVALNGVAQGTAIRTSGNVTLVADHISEASNGFIVAGTLHTTTRGDTTLTGPNRAGAFNATSRGDVNLSNTGELNVTGLIAAGDANISNVGDVTVSGLWDVEGTSTITVHSDIIISGTMDSPTVVLNAMDGAIVETPTGSITADTLTTFSLAQTDLGGANNVERLNSTSTGGLTFNNTAASFTLGEIETHGGAFDLKQTGDMTVTDARAYGAVQWVVGGSLALLGGSTAGAAAQLSSREAMSICVGGDLVLRGGSGDGAFARILGYSDINLTVGGFLTMQAGSGNDAYARIQTTSRDSVISLTFPTVNGGFTINGYTDIYRDGKSGFLSENGVAAPGHQLCINCPAP